MSDVLCCRRCGRVLHTGEAKVFVGLTLDQLGELVRATLSLDTQAKLLCAIGLLDPDLEAQIRRELTE